MPSLGGRRTKLAQAFIGVCMMLALAAPAGASHRFVTQWGSFGTADGQFNQPYGVALDPAGNVYVTDSVNHRVQKFGPTGSSITEWGSLGTGNGQFNEPRSVAVDSSGNVYVTDLRNNRVQKFTSSGQWLAGWGGVGAADGLFNGPVGIDTDPAGNVYVAEQGNHRVQVFTPAGGFITKWGTFGAADGQFNEPYDVEVDRSGNVYVLDGANRRIQKFTSAGQLLAKWGSAGSGDGQFNLGGGGLSTDAAGRVYLADYANHRIQVFGPTGAFLEKFTGPGAAVNAPADLAVDGAGNVYVVNRFPHNVQRFAPPGSSFRPVVSQPPVGLSQAVPAPILGRRVNVEPVRGQVFVSVPAGSATASRGARASVTVPGIKGRQFVPLSQARQIPVRSLLDTRRGTVRLTSARGSGGATQSSTFTSGVFQVLQSRRSSAKGLTDLVLKGSTFRTCGRISGKGSSVRSAARRGSRRRIRRLRGNGSGRFRTRGRYSAATVRGTDWTVTDRCDGTLTQVRRGRVTVRDFRRRKNVTLKAGKSYLARPRR